MTRKSKTVITVEAMQRTVISRRRESLIGWCDVCAAQARMLSPNEAARWTATTTRNLYREIENGALHFSETAEGEPFVCLTSLLKLFGQH